MIKDHAYDDGGLPAGNGCQVLVPLLVGQGDTICGRPRHHHASERTYGDMHEPKPYTGELDWA